MNQIERWIGVDLDGTLAEYDGWRGWKHIGKPIPEMVARVKQFLKNGQKVKIFTARAFQASQEELLVIQDWCEEHIGEPLEITNVKDFGMVALYDDRAFRVEFNTGKIL